MAHREIESIVRKLKAADSSMENAYQWARDSMQALEEAVGKKTLDKLTLALKTPQGAADLLGTLPGEERLRVLEMIQAPSKSQALRNTMLGMYRTLERAPGGVAAGVSNALAPESENVNALAP